MNLDPCVFLPDTKGLIWMRGKKPWQIVDCWWSVGDEWHCTNDLIHTQISQLLGEDSLVQLHWRREWSAGEGKLRQTENLSIYVCRCMSAQCGESEGVRERMRGWHRQGKILFHHRWLADFPWRITGSIGWTVAEVHSCEESANDNITWSGTEHSQGYQGWLTCRAEGQVSALLLSLCKCIPKACLFKKWTKLVSGFLILQRAGIIVKVHTAP